MARKLCKKFCSHLKSYLHASHIKLYRTIQRMHIMIDPTKETYDSLTTAYDFFNAELFEGRLPHCLITMQRGNRFQGYFCGDRFSTKGNDVTDEIAMNPTYLKVNSTEESLAVLVHEMTHLEQHHFGKPSRTGYHNLGWSKLMLRVGLIPSDTFKPGGKQTGQKVGHYIEPNGLFEKACASLLATGFDVRYGDQIGPAGKRSKEKAASKTKYTCLGCGANAWAKPATKLICGGCNSWFECKPYVAHRV